MGIETHCQVVPDGTVIQFDNGQSLEVYSWSAVGKGSTFYCTQDWLDDLKARNRAMAGRSWFRKLFGLPAKGY